jgi:hypothetical protein
MRGVSFREHTLCEVARIRKGQRMFFGKDSPFLRLPAGLPRKQILFFDGIRYSVEMTVLAYHRLRTVATELSRAVSLTKEPDPTLFTAALADAWSIIDSTHRLRELISDAPGFTKKQRSVELRVFNDRTADVETLRHKVQHLRGEIRTVAETDHPVWGVLSWWSHFAEEPDILRRCQLAAGTLFQSDYPEFKLEKMWLASPVDRFELTAHGVSVSLTDTHKAVERVARAIEDALGEGLKAFPQEAPTSGADMLACIEFRRGSEDQGEPS